MLNVECEEPRADGLHSTFTIQHSTFNIWFLVLGSPANRQLPTANFLPGTPDAIVSHPRVLPAFPPRSIDFP
jgi:hypothetical protein